MSRARTWSVSQGSNVAPSFLASARDRSAKSGPWSVRETESRPQPIRMSGRPISFSDARTISTPRCDWA